MFSKSAIFCILVQLYICYGDELVGTIIIFRHGARAPRLFHPNDPYSNMSFWPVPKGELTEEGLNDAYELGRWARHRYNNFLPRKYSSNDFFIYSSGVDRTLMSASLFTSGLYPAVPPQNLPYQPIPIHSKPPHLDNTITVNQPCPTLEFQQQKIMKSDLINRINEDNEEIYQYLSTHMGMPVTSFKGLHAYYDTFFIEERFNFTLPEWTKKVYPEKLLELALYNVLIETYDLLSSRFKVGCLYSEILAYLESFSKAASEFGSDFGRGNKGRKMMAISGHDCNIADLLSYLKFPVNFWPSYSSAVIFELRKKNESDFYVSAFFKNSTGLLHLDIAGCGLECELNEFVDYVRPVVMDPKNWRQQCILDHPK